MFIVNVSRHPKLPVDLNPRLTIHHPCCRMATLTRHWYRIDATEVMRRHARIRSGDGGTNHMCQLCRPDVVAAMVVDPT